MKNNKLISVVLALLVCLTLVVSASAANNELTFTLESSDSFVEGLDAIVANEGETFTVSVNISNNPGFLAAIATLNYDSSALKLEKTVCSNGVSVVAKDGKVDVLIGDLMNAVTAPAKAEKITTTGSVVELTFKVLSNKDAVTELALSVNNKQVVDLDGKYTITATGAVMSVNAVAKNHECDVNNTIDANTGKEATCTEEGKESDLLCAHCGKVAKEGAVIPAMDHAWDNGVETKAPTCTDMGVITYTCGNCGETKTNDSPALGHAWGEYTVTKEATADAEGEETRTCANCQAKETRSIAKLPAADPTPAKSNTGLIIAIVVVVVLAGAGAAAFFVLKNKKK